MYAKILVGGAIAKIAPIRPRVEAIGVA